MNIKIYRNSIITLTAMAILSGCGGGGTGLSGSNSSDNMSQIISTGVEAGQSSDKTLKITSVETMNTQKDSTIIKWELTKPATGQIEYGIDKSYGDFSKKEESFKYTLHTIPLKNLQPDTIYHYRVISEDNNGNEVISKDHTFKTMKVREGAIATIDNSSTNINITLSGKVNTTWGFKPFALPNKVIEVPVNGNIQDAIDKLSNGGIIKLSAGTYHIHSSIRIGSQSNIMIKGAGKGNTLLKADKGIYYIMSAQATHNIIFSDFSIDATGNTGNGLQVNGGSDNILIKNVKVTNASGNNIAINLDRIGSSNNITLQNVEANNAKRYHGIGIGTSKSVLIDSSKAYGNAGYGIDCYSDFIEITNTILESNQNYAGMKFPNSNHLYIHDNVFKDNGKPGLSVGVKFARRSYRAYVHFENNIITGHEVPNATTQAVYGYEPYAEVVFKNNIVSNNIKYNYLVLSESDETYTYGDEVRSLEGEDIHLVRRPKIAMPSEDGVGYTTWGNP